ncbi:MAG: hypothetical protein GY772_29570 [bacterium]|nr:hypothetical protein [bacterium]
MKLQTEGHDPYTIEEALLVLAPLARYETRDGSEVDTALNAQECSVVQPLESAEEVPGALQEADSRRSQFVGTLDAYTGIVWVVWAVDESGWGMDNDAEKGDE